MARTCKGIWPSSDSDPDESCSKPWPAHEDRFPAQNSWARRFDAPLNFGMYRTPTREGQEPITFEEFHAALQAIEQLFKNYYGLFAHQSLVQTEPVAQFDEFEAFGFSWIEDEDKFDYEKRSSGG